uniref:Uncharacterized protein n=1 Tax=Calcidiscus leptoporus TaxID=127549 RepID=A0A7S0JH29_9EUKA|mmetsp:Transcript_58491/g.134197  ORF Transcript_58491/g.134197 Transcript_58491/m.134197 type:complete len:257 (+) Transcript_58491:39-809(+)
MLLVVAMSSALLLPLQPAPQFRRDVPQCAPRARVLCQEETLPEGAQQAIPPEQLADAWRRDEQAKGLADDLKGCSIYLIGCGERKLAIGRILAKRLRSYRFYDVPSLMCSTYRSMPSADDVETVGQLCAAEGVDDVAQLSRLVMDQVQSCARSVVSVWEGAVARADFAVMQQGIVVNLVEAMDAARSGVSAEQLEAWAVAHAVADLSLEVKEGVPFDDVVLKLVAEMRTFIEKNPAKTSEWKARADATLAANPPSE